MRDWSSAVRSSYLPRHLGSYRRDFHARWIEDRDIIGAPLILDVVALRHCALRPAGAVGQRLVPPDRARVGRHDRPVHAGEAALKKGCGQPEDAVRWFEPRREALAPRFPAEPPETHEGEHLVDVATAGLVGPPQPVDLRVGRARSTAPGPPRAPDDPVDRKSCGT